MTTKTQPNDRLIALSRDLMEEQTLLKAFSDSHQHINHLRRQVDAIQNMLIEFEQSIVIRPDGKHIVDIELVAAYGACAQVGIERVNQAVKSVVDTLDTVEAQCDSIEARFDRTECPRCGEVIPNVEHRGEYLGAISRLDNQTEVCSTCGCEEALGGLMGGWHRLISSVIEGRYRHAHPELSNSKGA